MPDQLIKKYLFMVVTDDPRYAGTPQRVEYFAVSQKKAVTFLKARFGKDAKITFVEELPCR